MTSSIYYIVAVVVIVSGAVGGVISTIVYIVRKNDKIKYMSEKMPELLALISRVNQLENKMDTGSKKLEENKQEIQDTEDRIDSILEKMQYSNKRILKAIGKLARHLNAEDVVEFLEDDIYESRSKEVLK